MVVQSKSRLKVRRYIFQNKKGGKKFLQCEQNLYSIRRIKRAKKAFQREYGMLGRERIVKKNPIIRASSHHEVSLQKVKQVRGSYKCSLVISTSRLGEDPFQ